MEKFNNIAKKQILKILKEKKIQESKIDIFSIKDKINFLRINFIKYGYVYVGRCYHLQFETTDEKLIDKLLDIFEEYNFPFKKINRKNGFIVYIKSKETISDFLAFLGAYRAVTRLNELIVEKQVRGRINREDNCYFANTKKTIDKAGEQLKAIQYLKENNIFNQLDKKIKDVALLREQYPTDSLNQLAEKMNLSKSLIQYRLGKIIEQYNKHI